MRLRDAAGAVTTRVVPVRAAAMRRASPRVQWARLTLASLEGEARTNKVRIREIGKRFGLATRETSLIVLELVDDYVRHEIEPPAELRAAYDRAAASVGKRRGESDAARLAQVVRRFEARVAWWNRDFPKGDLPAPLAIAKSEARRERDRLADGARSRRAASAPTADARGCEGRRSRRGARRLPLPAAAAPAPPGFAAQAGTDSLAARQEERRRSDASDDDDLDRLDARRRRKRGDEAPRGRRADEWARVYLDERRGNEASVGFFLDAAEFFLAQGDATTAPIGLRVLSNLAELDLQNRQVLRLLAYRLQQAGETGAALPVFERVARAGAERAAVAPRPRPRARRRRPGASGGRPAVRGRHRRVGRSLRRHRPDRPDRAERASSTSRAATAAPLDLGAIDKRLLRNLPLDVRVVLAWDADNTDVDLHVIDPNGEEVFYGHNLSYQGGAITRDATGGYGPEEFALRVAKPGKYRVEANFFGHRAAGAHDRHRPDAVAVERLRRRRAAGPAHDGPRQERTRRARRGRRVRGEGERHAVSRPARGRRAARLATQAAGRARRTASARLVGAGPGLRGELRRHRLDLVLAHVVVHVAPAGEDRGAVGLLVDRVAVLDRPAGVAAGARRSPCRRPRARRRSSPATRCRACRSRPGAGAASGEDEGEAGAAHGRRAVLPSAYRPPPRAT